ncbi:MAG TPA: DUF2784 domain-containing protein [Burkholderiales bacterium]|nr:DUF2784 domain-containing protein [Burkholderiales bacterium]
MNYFKILADLVVILHFLFVIFALFGALLSLRWIKIIWIQITAAVWAAMVEFGNMPCPLTPVEKWFIEKEGVAAYKDSFVEHHILSILYPGEVGFGARLALGSIVILCNLGIYAFIFRRIFKNDLK